MELPNYDASFDIMWENAAAEFRKSTGKPPIDHSHTIGRVVKEIQALEAGNEKSKERTEKVKAVMSRVQGLGELAAQGASTAFPPSQLCSTAIFYLVNTCWAYKAQKYDVEELFDAIIPFLKRYDKYLNTAELQTGVDARLKAIINELLQCFVRICSRYTQVSRENPGRRALKALFRHDSGAKEEMEKIQKLEVEEGRMRGVLVHQEVLKTGLKVDDLQKKYSDRNDNELMDQYQETIKNALNIDDSQHNWHDTQRSIWNDITDSTGQWLFNRQDFKDWENSPSASAPSVFALEAGEGYGRAYLCAAVINHLQQQKPTDPNTKRSVAYYYFKKDEKDKNSMKKALNAVVWQLCMNKSNKAFAQFFAKKCDASDNLSCSKTHELWEASILDYSRQSPTSNQTFIIIDGIGHASEEFEELSRIVRDVALFENQNTTIRLLLTGAARDFSKLGNALHEYGRTAINKITVNKHNRSDLRKFISRKMQKICESWEPNSDNEEYRKHIAEELLNKTDGDYEKLNLTLLDISQKAGKDEIDRILGRVGEPREEAIKREVDRLQRTLSEREIDSLNEILPWIVLPKYDWPTMMELKAVLFLKHGNRPLMSLQKLIREKYAPLLIVDGKLVRSYSTMKYFKRSKKGDVSSGPEFETPATAKQTPLQGTILAPLADLSTHSVTCQVHNLEIAMVKKFLSAVCDEKLFDRFGFNNFFERLQNPSGKVIHFERVDGHARIILACLKALCSQDAKVKAEAEPLHEYAITNLRWHLSQIRPDDLPCVEAQKRREIGQLLYNIFMERECISTWITPKRIQRVRHEWLYHPPKENKRGLAREALTWFEDPEVIGGLGHHQRGQVNRIIYGSSRPGDLFLEATKMVAKNWLGSQTWDVAQTVWWVLGFIQDRTEHHIGDDGKTHKDSETIIPPLEHIYNAERWAKSNGAVGESLLADIRLIDTLFRFQYIREAREQATKRDSSGWMTDWCIARELHGLQDLQATLEYLNRLILKFRSDADLRQLLSVTWKEIVYMYASTKEQNGDWEDALMVYLELLQSFPEDSKTTGKAIHCMKRQQNYSRIIEMLENRTKDATEHSRMPLRTLFLDLARSAEFHHDITFTARHEGHFSSIKNGYVDAIGAAEPGSDTLSYLRYYYGLALWYQKDKVREDAEEAIWTWEQNVFDSETPKDSYIQRITSFKLSSVYLQLAKEYGFKTSAGWFHVKKLETLVQRRSKEFQWTGSEEVLLARAYHLAGYKTKAKELAAKQVGPALEILSDKDPENDWEGFTSLSNTLGHMDDDENALAAKSLIGPLQRKWTRSDSADSLTEITYLRGRLKSSCDNQCGQKWNYATDMHVCRACIRTIICGKCLQQLRNGTMEYRLCDKNHEFLEVRTFDQAPGEHVWVGGNLETIQKWKGEVRSKYGL
ncbi:hypothetical protein B0J12DRAFT_358165 [Macrophomina phaseolina]|uniref:Fungal STAND N-terminal Goodbye domain-containing protein n=1 Tax=Macrophomina phaseolina TaxID=35725 RepID=A0ABQ8FUE9_9PEZI|nr:hypothetical protein B0J12DRAFT_358165 [Macrophomina phaseolina]